jgi:hypothetical protein
VVKWLLPPAWRLRYQMFGRFGIVLLLVLLSTNTGRNFLVVFMKPVQTLMQYTFQTVLPFLVKTPSEMGII